MTHDAWPSDLDPHRVAPGPSAAEARLRLSDYRCLRTPAGVCRIEVELEHQDGRRAIGRAEAATSAAGELRVAAEAALRALEQALPDGPRFDLLGVKCLRAFDASIVIVAVATERFGAPSRLLGCVQAASDLDRAAVLAVLDATNRVSALGAAR